MLSKSKQAYMKINQMRNSLLRQVRMAPLCSETGSRQFFMSQRQLTLRAPKSMTVRSFAAGNYPEHIVLEMPNLSPTMEKGNIKSWNKQVGDEIAPGDVLAAIETDKAVVDFEMQEEGFVAKILYEAGAKDVPLGAPVAILVDSKEDVAAFANYSADSAGESASEPIPQAAAPTPSPASSASPAASYPDHITLEMPNLSPTMEKVRKCLWNHESFIG